MKKRTSLKSMEKAVRDALGINSPSELFAVGTKTENEPKAEPQDAPKPAEEWIWVNGYKGTNKDMTCLGYQYEMNKCFDISDDKPVKECEHGFHLCLNMNDVFYYYEVGEGHRFFKVKALVRKKDIDAYGRGECRISFSNGSGYTMQSSNDKLVAKSIIFVQELTADEILRDTGAKNWSVEDKQLALEIGIRGADNVIKERKLVSLGYSETFAKLIISSGKFDTAKAVGTQEGLSMDMKAWIIFNK